MLKIYFRWGMNAQNFSDKEPESSQLRDVYETENCRYQKTTTHASYLPDKFLLEKKKVKKKVKLNLSQEY